MSLYDVWLDTFHRTPLLCARLARAAWGRPAGLRDHRDRMYRMVEVARTKNWIAFYDPLTLEYYWEPLKEDTE